MTDVDLKDRTIERRRYREWFRSHTVRGQVRFFVDLEHVVGEDMTNPSEKHAGIPQPDPSADPQRDPDQDSAEEERFRCHDVLMKYRKTDRVLTGRKLARAIRRLKCPRRKQEVLDAEPLRRLFRLENPGSEKPVPVRELWTSGMSFLSREKLHPGQNLLCVVCFGAHYTHHRTVIYVQGCVETCGEGKGLYPWKVEVSFTDLNRHAAEVLSHPQKHIPKG